MKTQIRPVEQTFDIAGELTVNRMGYGAMRITGNGIWGPPKNHNEAIQVLKRVVDLGINFIDTADSYGPYVSEKLIAEALYPYPEGVVIATKGGLERTGPNQWPVNGHPDHLRKALHGSLERLKLAQIDLYQLHRIDPKVPFEQIFEFLQSIQEDGLVKHIGLSEVSVEDIQKAEQYITVASVQNMYSVDNRKWEAELEYCEQNDMAFIPWYPIGGGNLKATETLETIAKKHNATSHQIALSWLLYHSPNVLLIPGTSNVQHLEENFDSVNIVLDEEDITSLDGISQ